MNRSHLIPPLQKVIQHCGEADRRTGPEDVYRHAWNSLMCGEVFTYCLRPEEHRLNSCAFYEESMVLRVLMVALIDVIFFRFLSCRWISKFRRIVLPASAGLKDWNTLKMEEACSSETSVFIWTILVMKTRKSSCMMLTVVNGQDP